MAKVLCVLYDDPVDGYPASYARDEIPQIGSYPGGQATPSTAAAETSRRTVHCGGTGGDCAA